MIKIKIQAGLGNQMFQYALARSIKENTKKNILLDLSFYKNGLIKGDTLRGYELDKFNINQDLNISFDTTSKLAYLKEKIIRKITRESSYVFYKKYLNPKRDGYFIGFWQSEKYFKNIEEIIRKEFTLKNKIEDRNETDEAKIFLDKIKESKNSISINIRRGDYVENIKTRMYHGLISKDYFINGVRYIVNKLNLKKDENNIFVFSDDIEWCKNNLLDLKKEGELVFVSENLNPTDSLYLISKCQHNVIANSSFSWWGAWLNQNKDKIIIAPKNWMRSNIDTKDICPEEWIRLENRFY